MFKKSGLQKRREIKAARAEKARHGVVDVYCDVAPKGSLLADKKTLREVNPLGPLPNFYVDRHFECKDCGSDEIWTAKQQKWWYEVANGCISSVAVRCRSCRHKEKLRKAESRKEHLEGLEKKHKK